MLSRKPVILLKRGIMTQKERSIPHHTSTHDFEHYVPGTPILSSRSLGWESVMVRAYQDSTEMQENWLMPTSPDILLTLTISGTAYVEARTRNGPWASSTIHVGDLSLTPGDGVPYELRWKRLSTEPIHTLYLHLSQHVFAQAVEELADRDPTRLMLQDCLGFQDPLLSQLSLALQQEVRQPVFANRLYAETIAETMIVHLLRRYSTQHVVFPEATQGLSHQQTRRVSDFILAHLQEHLSLGTLAQQVGLSSYHFARLFRQTTGETAHKFVLRKRLEAAQHL